MPFPLAYVSVFPFLIPSQRNFMDILCLGLTVSTPMLSTEQLLGDKGRFGDTPRRGPFL